MNTIIITAGILYRGSIKDILHLASIGFPNFSWKEVRKGWLDSDFEASGDVATISALKRCLDNLGADCE